MKLDFIVSLFASSISEIGKHKLVEVLQNLHDTNEADYKAAITGGYALVKHLQPVTDSSKNKIDDVFVNGLSNAISISANANGIVL